jgi:outer membrane protein assembly factor BamB
MADGNDAVALGCIAESEDCQLLGFDVSGKLRYARPAAPYGLQRHHDGYCDLAFGRMICQRYVDQGTAVFAVDVASGEIRWSTTVAAGKGGVLGRPGITPTRVWVPWHDNERHNSVYAIDAVTGALLGAAGM